MVSFGKHGSKFAIAGAVLTGVVVSTGVMWNASNAAFTASTDNAANNWQAGSVSLTDDDSGAAMFEATNLRPGATGEHCIQLTYSGTLSPASVKLYGTEVSGDLSQYLNLVVDEGSGGDFGDCAGFTATGNAYTGTLDNFGTTITDWSSGVGTFAPTGAGQTKTYRFAYTVDPATPNSAQGATRSADHPRRRQPVGGPRWHRAE